MCAWCHVIRQGGERRDMFAPLQDRAAFPVTPYGATGGDPIAAAALAGEVEADVAVIGGGIAGASLALHAAEAGARVVVLEANEVGWGASGRNSGHVAPATKHEPQAILQLYGRARGERLLAAARSGPELVFHLAEKHRMNADVVRSGVVSAANTQGARDTLRQRAEFLKARGYDVEFHDRYETSRLLGNDPTYYLGCCIDRHGGTLNPLAYVRGLARASIAAGASVFEHSRATQLTREGRRWRVTAAGGSVVASHVALCMNAYGGDLWPGLERSIVPVRAYQFLTSPLPAAVRATVLPGRQGLTDTRRLMSGIRVLADGRMLFSGQGPLFGDERRPFVETSLRRVVKAFPQIAGTDVESWWSGWMAMNHENSWKLHELAPGLVAMLGCNGRGVALATILGAELAAFMQGKPTEELVLPFVAVAPIRMHAVHRPLVHALVSYYKLRDNIDERRTRRAAD